MFDIAHRHDNNPSNYDLRLLDISKDTLSIEISDLLKHTFMSDSRDEKLSIVEGRMFGHHHRMFVSLPTTYKRIHKNIFFLVDTYSPYTYLSDETMNHLKIEHKLPPTGVLVEINHKPIRAFVSASHFRDINILGTNFLDGLKLNIEYRHPYRFDLIFPDYQPQPYTTATGAATGTGYNSTTQQQQQQQQPYSSTMGNIPPQPQQQQQNQPYDSVYSVPPGQQHTYTTTPQSNQPFSSDTAGGRGDVYSTGTQQTYPSQYNREQH